MLGGTALYMRRENISNIEWRGARFTAGLWLRWFQREWVSIAAPSFGFRRITYGARRLRKTDAGSPNMISLYADRIRIFIVADEFTTETNQLFIFAALLKK
jgi:hypothetical protein